MKHQYVGDISDYRKYALLRALSMGGANKLGICWMLTPDDDGPDGRKLTYLQQPERYRNFDPELFDILAHTASKPNRRRLQTMEESSAVVGALFYNETLPDDVPGRAAFMEDCTSAFHETELVFLDPDNGLEVSLPKGRKNSSKYLYLDEVAALYEANKSLLIYQHFPRVERASFMALRVQQLRGVSPGCAIWAFTTAHVVFFLVIHPTSPAGLAVAAIEACNRWDPDFIRGAYLPVDRPGE